jgi:sulfopyruvate decarboxylase subunit beta
MRRADCLAVLSEAYDEQALVVTPTGASYRYWEALGRAGQISHINLGLCFPLGLGLALALPNRRILVLDGDGSLLFNLSSLVDLGRYSPPNLVGIVFDNEGYESCDSISSATASTTDLQTVARGCGISHVSTLHDLDEFGTAVEEAATAEVLTMLIAKIELEERPFEETPSSDGKENKYRFVRHVEELEGNRIFRPFG